MPLHGYQQVYGHGIVARDAHGRPSPIVLHLMAEFRRLRAQCEAQGLPDRDFSDASSFVRVIADKFAGQFNAWDDPHLVVSLREASKGLALSNLKVGHGDV